MGLSYNNLARLKQTLTIRSKEEKQIETAGEFPNCKGLYPDCPENPTLKNKMCRNCPKTENPPDN